MAVYKTNFTIKISGTDVSTDFQNDLLEVIVDSSLGMPAMCSIRLSDAGLKWMDDATLDLGKPLEVSAVLGQSMSGTTSNSPVLIFKGEITALEPHFFNAGKSEMVIRGYDKSHRLHRGRKTRTFISQKDSDLASTIAGEAGLSVDVDAATVTHEHILQYNQTNMEFLMSRAEKIGYQVFVINEKLYFKKGEYSPASVATLKFLEDLIEFEPRWTAHHQADNMYVKSWDPKLKTAISSTNTPNAALNQGGMSKTGGAAATAAFSAADEIIVNQPVFTTAEADAIVAGLRNDISRDFVQAEGLCHGNPAIQAGTKITIANVGTRFNGDYLVTSATHIRTMKGYETRFTISGRHANTLSSLVNSKNDSALDTAAVSGVVTGLVTNLADPDDLGRVKVKYAWLGAIESHWMRIANPMAGAARGMEILPEINDEVLIAFEHGDIHHPVIVGALWSKTDAAPEKNSVAVVGGKVVHRIFKTRAGHLVLFDDSDGAEKVSIKSKSGHEMIMDDASGSEAVTLKDKAGNSMVIKSSNNSLTITVTGDFIVNATGKITLNSTADMSMASKANITVDSKANVSMKGIQLAMEGSAKSELKGATVSVNGSAQTEVKGGAMVSIQGGIVKIN